MHGEELGVKLDGRASKSGAPVIAVRDGAKRYGGIAAIEGIEFELLPGQVHAIVGENGSGKSTLCKAIAGVVQLDEGEVLLDGVSVTFRTPRDALDAGIAMVYQESGLVPTMTVAQNIRLGSERRFNSYRVINADAQQLLQAMSFHIDPAALVSTLGAAQKQMVQIVRAMRANPRVVIFDEPTAFLTPEEVMHLFQAIRGLQAKGVGVVFVSHAIEEALLIADRISVLRDGKLQITDDASAFDRERIVRFMVGRQIETQSRLSPAESAPSRRKVLSVENVTLGNVVKNMSFSAYTGEVVVIAGLVGSGRTEALKIVAGALKRNRIHGGLIYVNGKRVRYRVPRQAVRDGIAYITEDRRADGFFERASIEENIFVGWLAATGVRSMFVSERERSRIAEGFIGRLSVRAISLRARVIELSGGNQQKVTVAKSLVQNPNIVIFDEPTRGVDVGAIGEIHQMIRELASEGKAVIVISSYLPEVFAVADRILVARQGRVVVELNPENTSETEIMYAAVF